MTHTFYGRRGKRLFDILFAVPAAVALAPVLALLALLVRLRLGRPSLFLQKRGGWHGEPFYLVKLRTMTDERDSMGDLLPDHQRLLPLGRALRSLSLDEIPELINVIRGEMSLVGPRPFLYEYMAHYSDRERRRHEVRPGMTGLAQVMGRNGLSWQERFDFDLEYVEKMCFRLDIRILALTSINVIRQHGINQSPVSTSNRFDQGAGRECPDNDPAQV